jgi:outer membrane receptor protein involved in Fe transport
LLGLDRARPATFHLDLSTELSNSYLPSVGDLGGKQSKLETAYRGLLFGKSFDYGSFFRPSGDNNWRVTAKTSWAPHPAHKLSFTYIKSLGFSGLFNSVDIGEINRNITSYPWQWSRRLDHHYTIAEDFYSLSLQWRHTLSDEMYQQLRLKRGFNAVHRDVGGRHWSEYEIPYDQVLDSEGLGDPYFQDTGDASEYRDRYSDLVGADWELVHETEHHHLATGVESTYEDLQYFSLDAYSVSPTEPLGKEFDLFHVYPSKINLYAQDRIEYPGINLKLGIRADTFFPGEQAERLYLAANRPGFNEATREEWDANTHAIFGQRYKLRWSPRVAVSHPITENSHLFVNYGRFTQWPTYFFLYAKTGGISSEEFPRIGNPNLEPEVSAQYEFGAGHKFTDVFSLRATVFFKDIYDYPTSIPVEIGSRSTRRQTFFIYRNLDYARSRGIEIEVQRRRRKHTWFSASYSYTVATGKSSDPNGLKLVQALGGDARETDLEEQFMWWNRPHKLTFSGGYQADAEDEPPVLFGWPLPRDWKISTYWLLQAGEAYTPTSPTGAPIAKDYSANGPIDSVVDVDFSKKFRIGEHRFQLTAVARNLFNHRTVLQVDSATGFTPRPGLGSYWRDFQNPQTLFLNHALAQETDADAASFTSENNSVRRAMTDAINPAFVAAPRSVRLGISYEW